MFYILVLEDDCLQRKNLVRMIKDLGNSFKVLEADTIKKAFEISKKYKIDLFILDIQVNDGSGLEFAKKIREDNHYEFTWIIFLTCYKQYLSEAVRKAHCYDYIVKPYDKYEVQNIIKKLLTNQIAIQKENKKYLTVNIGGIIVKILVNDIFFIEAYRKNSIIHTISGKYEIKRTTLKEILKKVQDLGFLQCHRSYIINRRLVEKIDTRKKTWEIYFEGYDKSALVGNTYKEKIKDKI